MTHRHARRQAPVDLDAEGFLASRSSGHARWRTTIARENGIAELTDRHWQVIDFMRTTYLRPARHRRSGRWAKVSGVPVKELYQLFPKGPAKLAAKIAGIPKPRGCI